MKPANDHNRRLAAMLDVAGYPPSIVAMAREGHWSDFGSPLPFPKVELVQMLRADGHEDACRRVELGEFDG